MNFNRATFIVIKVQNVLLSFRVISLLKLRSKYIQKAPTIGLRIFRIWKGLSWLWFRSSWLCDSDRVGLFIIIGHQFSFESHRKLENYWLLYFWCSINRNFFFSWGYQRQKRESTSHVKYPKWLQDYLLSFCQSWHD